VARTNEAAVRGIIKAEVSISLTPFIQMANGLVTELCTVANGPDTPYGNERLELIERWLSAHFYTNYDPRLEQQKAGEASGKYQSKVDLGLMSSHYGQTAIYLDTNGKLAEFNRKNTKPASPGDGKSTSILWLGTEAP